MLYIAMLRPNLLILLSFSLSACAGEPRNPQVYGVVFGDSLAQGYGVTNKENDLAHCLTRKSNEYFVNLGIKGDTTEGALNRVNSILELRPQVAIISLGGNDILKYIKELPSLIYKKAQFSKQKTFENLEVIYQALNAAKVRTFHMGISPPRTLSNWKSLIRDSRLEEIEDIAINKGVTFIPRTLRELWTNPELMFDNLHPNDNGYKIVCDRVYEALDLR